MNIFSSEMTKVRRSMLGLVEIAGEVSNQSKLNDTSYSQLRNLKVESALLNHRISSLVDKLYSAVQFANDVVRDQKGVVGFESLENKVVELGLGLKGTLEFIELYRAKRDSGAQISGFSPSAEGVILSNPVKDLNDLFGVNAHVLGRTMYQKERGAGDRNGYSIYRDTIVAQYILATGSVMAKIAEIPEGRGSVRDRLEQEAQFRLAQIKGLLGASNNNSERTSTSTTVQVYSGRHSTLGDIQRRDFVVPKLSAEREMIEDRLWKVFFEKAGFDQGSMREHANTLCSRLLSGAPGLPK